MRTSRNQPRFVLADRPDGRARRPRIRDRGNEQATTVARSKIGRDWRNTRFHSGDPAGSCRALIATVFEDLARDLEVGSEEALRFIRFAGDGSPGDFIFWCHLADLALGTNNDPRVVAERLIRTHWLNGPEGRRKGPLDTEQALTRALGR